MATTTTRFAQFAPDKRTLTMGAAIVNLEVLLVLLYITIADVIPLDPWIYVYPFVWINVAVYAVWKTRIAPSGTRQRRIAFGVAAAYLLVLFYAGGLIGPGHGLHGHAHTAGFRIGWLPPGWGPALLYSGYYLNVAVHPYMLVGYLSLAYLVYATIIDAAGSAALGVLGLLSCVSCTWPVLATLVTGFAGASSGIATAVTAQSYALSTVVFVVTVGFLYWRPFKRS